MNASHTPGPWEACEWSCHARTTIKSATGIVVAETNGLGRHSDECLADARLIAIAPELLEFAKMYLDCLSTTTDLDAEAKRILAKVEAGQ